MKPRKPSLPQAPEKMIRKETVIETRHEFDSPICFANYTPETQARIEVEGYYDDYHEAKLVIFTETMVENPDYEKQLAKYEKAMTKYRQDLAAWEAYHAMPPAKRKEEEKKLQALAKIAKLKEQIADLEKIAQ